MTDTEKRDSTKAAWAADAGSPDQATQTGDPAHKTKADEEIGGPKGPDPTRFGDWERKGRCIDF